jgi:cyclophilin family peptidyl-prolyl cis-trans isomerase
VKSLPRAWLTYVREGFYDGTVFHRVIDGFMIQGGGYTPQWRQKKTKAPIKNEAANGLKNTRGFLAMARTGDPHSATSQFFINVADNPFLDYREATVSGWGIRGVWARRPGHVCGRSDKGRPNRPRRPVCEGRPPAGGHH